MEVMARHLGNVKFELAARGHRVVCDQPAEYGGEDEGLTPPEFMLGALATCAGYYAAQYLKARGLSMEGLAVRVSAEKTSQPTRLGSFRIEVMAVPLEARHQDGVLRAVKNCLIHNTLLNVPKIEIALNPVALAA